jgi:polyhydroxyalkanoate synthase
MMGKEPFPFDLLYWNSDFTRLPAKMHSFYLRSMYMNNLLIQKNGLTLGGVPIDLRTITTPSYWISTREDHIAPWRATYTATQLFAGEKTFLLAGSGHIAGIINPPEKQKYGYWMNKALPPQAEDWLKDAVESKGSWWPQWQEWAAQKAGEQAPPRTLPTKGEDSPGRYVRVR